MAAYSKPVNILYRTDSQLLFKWTLTDTDLNGDWVQVPIGADKSVHAVFISGSGTITMQGSNQPGTPTAFFNLRRVDLAAILFTGTDGHQILENTLQVRPVLGGASGGTSIDVYLCVNGS